jgi:type II secretory pathway pseudopilin PulG
MSAELNESRKKPGARRTRRDEAGYTLLLALFFAALMIIAAAVAVPNLITQERRQKEKLMIWRGRQYARAIGLYYRKTGHFPHDLKELEKGIAGVHFLRQPYKDPMDQDGSWRLIYLGAGGQLIGSLCWQTLAQYEAAEMGMPLTGTGVNPTAKGATTAPAGQASGTENGMSGFFASGATTAFGQMSSAGTGTGAQKKAPAVPTCEMIGANPSSSIHPQIITEGQMIGGNLIGVAGRVDAQSIKHYMGANNYRYWEFIWNPQQGQQQAVPTNTLPAGGSGGGFGSSKTKTSAQPGAPGPVVTPGASPFGNNQSAQP